MAPTTISIDNAVAVHLRARRFNPEQATDLSIDEAIRALNTQVFLGKQGAVLIHGRAMMDYVSLYGNVHEWPIQPSLSVGYLPETLGYPDGFEIFSPHCNSYASYLARLIPSESCFFVAEKGDSAEQANAGGGLIVISVVPKDGSQKIEIYNLKFHYTMPLLYLPKL